MHPHHDGTKFIVPRRDDSPDVGVVPGVYAETLQDELAELTIRFFGASPKVPVFALEVVALLKRRAEGDVEDFSAPLPTPRAPITTDQRRRIVAAELGRFWDWMCKGRRVLDMGPRAFVIASHFRRSAVDGRTDQQAALEIGNDSRASINKIKADFRRMFGADYPGENGKGSSTKAKCKNSRIAQLQN